MSSVTTSESPALQGGDVKSLKTVLLIPSVGALGRRGSEGALTLTIRMKVSPDPGALGLLKRYRDAVNFAVGVILAKELKTISEVHRELYEALKSAFGLPSRIALDCYRDALATAKAWRRNPRRGIKDCGGGQVPKGGCGEGGFERTDGGH